MGLHMRGAGFSTDAGKRAGSRLGSSENRAKRRSAQLSVERLEERTLLSAEFRTINGTGNNVEHPEWGSAGVQLFRGGATVEYADGVSAPAGADRLGARAVSNAVLAQSQLRLSEHFMTGFVFQWGQFLDHDLDLSSSASPAEPFPVLVPTGDPILDPQGTGTHVIGLFRSKFDPTTGTGPGNPRQQINDITSYIDASMVYGSDDARAVALRTGVGGRLKTSTGDLMPFNTLGLANGNPPGLPADQLFVAGDIRANETIALTSIHTLFVREHNYWADRIAAADPGLTDEAIYQRARQIVGAEVQVITYNEFLPALLGPGALTPYSGYNASVDASVSNVFSTAGFRVGHTMLPSTLLRLDPGGNPIAEGNVSLRDAFFRPDRITNEGGIDPILRGLAFQTQQEIDSKIVDEVRNFLFDNAPANTAFDLGALNIQRGREHGLADYNQTRIDFGLRPAWRFKDINSDPNVWKPLQRTYRDINNVDVWVGGISEAHLPGTSMGPLFTAIWADQFERSRDGDHFWYQLQFSGPELDDLEDTTLAEIIRRNTGITTIQDNVFRAAVEMDVMPHSGDNSINLARTREIPLVTFTTGGFDATRVDPTTVQFAGARALSSRLADADHDGDLDLIVQFRTRDTNLFATYRTMLAQDLADGTLSSLHQQLELPVTGQADGQPFLCPTVVDLLLSGRARLRMLMDAPAAV